MILKARYVQEPLPHGSLHAGGDSASAYIPLSDSLMDKHQGAGGKHIRNLAHKNQEHGQLVHNQSSQNTDKN